MLVTGNTCVGEAAPVRMKTPAVSAGAGPRAHPPKIGFLATAAMEFRPTPSVGARARLLVPGTYEILDIQVPMSSLLDSGGGGGQTCVGEAGPASGEVLLTGGATWLKPMLEVLGRSRWAGPNPSRRRWASSRPPRSGNEVSSGRSDVSSDSES